MKRADAWMEIFNNQYLKGYLNGREDCLRENKIGKYADNSSKYDKSGKLYLDKEDDSDDENIKKHYEDLEY